MYFNIYYPHNNFRKCDNMPKSKELADYIMTLLSLKKLNFISYI